MSRLASTWLQRFFFAAEEGLDIVEDRLFRQIIADQARHIGIDRLVVGDAGAQRIGDHHIAGAIGVEQAGHAQRGILAEDQGVDEIIVDAAINDVDALQAGRGAGIDDIVIDQQVAAFHQLHAHLAGQEGMLEIGGVENARRQHRDGDIVMERRQASAASPAIPADIARSGRTFMRAEHAREGAPRHIAVGQHVGDAGGHPQIVFQHDEFALLIADQVAAADIDIGAMRHRQAAHLAAVMLGAIDHGARHHAVLQHPAVAIDVAQEKIERQDALGQAALRSAPIPAAVTMRGSRSVGMIRSVARLSL